MSVPHQILGPLRQGLSERANRGDLERVGGRKERRKDSLGYQVGLMNATGCRWPPLAPTQLDANSEEVLPSSSQGTGLPSGAQGWLSDLICLLGSGAGHTAQRVCYAVKGGQDAVQAARALV